MNVLFRNIDSPHQRLATESPEAKEVLENQATALLRGIATGDRASFDSFHGLFAGLIYSTALKVLRNPDVARDVMQEVLIKIWLKAASFDAERGKVSTWILTMARNKAIDRMRSIQRRARLNEQAEIEFGSDFQFDDRDAFQAASQEDDGRALRAALEEISPQQQEVIRLAYFGDMTYQQVAHVLGLPVSTVKARIRRGLHRLRALVGQALFPPHSLAVSG